VDGTGSGSYPVAGSGRSDINSSGVDSNFIYEIVMLRDGAATADRATDDDDDNGRSNERSLLCTGFQCLIRGETNSCGCMRAGSRTGVCLLECN
jgi:hypothetical protein